MAAGDVLVRVGANVKGLVASMAVASASTIAFGSVVAGVGASVAGGFALMAGASALAIGGMVKVASDFETAFVGVAKVLVGTPEQFDALSGSIREMSRRLPFGTTEIANVARAAGQLGVEIDDVAEFTEVMLNLSATTADMSAEEAAVSFARFGNIMDMPMSQADKLGSVLTILGNNSAATEGEIMRLGLRLAGAGKQVGLSEQEVLAFSSVLSSLGLPIESAGTAFSRVFLEMQQATLEGGDSLDAFADTAGITAEEFTSAFEDDPARATVDFIKGLKGISDEGESVMTVLEEVGLSELRVRDALLRSINAIDLYEDALVMGSEEWVRNTALTEEAGKRYDTFESQVKVLWNRIQDLALIIGTPLMHALSDMLTAIDPLITYVEGLAANFFDLSDKAKRNTAVILLLTPVILALIAAFVAAITVFALVLSNFSELWASIKLITTGFRTMLPAITAISGPVIAIIAVLALFTAAVVALWTTNEEFRDNVMIIWEAVKTIMQAALDTVTPLIEVLIGIIVALVQVMMPVVEWVAEVAATFATWIAELIEANTWIQTAIQVIVVITGVIAAVIVVVKVLATVFAVVTGIIALFTAPVLIAIGVVAALIAIFYSLWQGIQWLGEKFEWIGDIIEWVTEGAQKIWEGFLGFFTGKTDEATEEVGDSFEKVNDKGKGEINDLAITTAETTEMMKDDVNGNVGMMQTETTAAFGKMREDGTMEAEYMKDLTTGETTDMKGKIIGDAEGAKTEAANEFAEMGDMTTEEAEAMNANVTAETGEMTDVAGADIDEFTTDGVVDYEAYAESITGSAEGANASVTGETGEMTGDMQTMIDDATSGGEIDFEELERVASESAEGTNKDVTSSFGDMSDNTKNEFEGIKDTASMSMDEVASETTTSMAKMSNDVSKSMSKLGETSSDSLGLLIEAVRASFNSINRAISKATSKMNRTVSNGLSKMINTYKTSLRSIKTAVTSGMNNALTAIKNGNIYIVANVRSLNGKFYNAGIHAMNGLQNGLNSRRGNVMNTARGIANSVSNTLRNALKVSSPSRVTTEIGEFVGDGLAKGIDGSARLVDKASEMLAESAIPDVDMDYAIPGGTAKSLRSAVNGTVDVNSRDGMLSEAIDDLRRDMTNLRVEMDGKEVGKITEPYVTDNQNVKRHSKSVKRIRR